MTHVPRVRLSPVLQRYTTQRTTSARKYARQLLSNYVLRDGAGDFEAWPGFDARSLFYLLDLRSRCQKFCRPSFLYVSGGGRYVTVMFLKTGCAICWISCRELRRPRLRCCFQILGG